MAGPPTDLIEAFQAKEDVVAVGALFHEDGFDEESVRILAIWSGLEHRWSEPEGERPAVVGPAMWRWLWSGARLDFFVIGDAARVPYLVAKEKVAVLIAAHSIYPDGKLSKGATAAMQGLIRDRLEGDRKNEKGAEKKLKARVAELERQLADAYAAKKVN